MLRGIGQMGTIKLEGSAGCSDTIVSNIFIDEYMPGANGEFVKIYLYLLRSLSVHDADISVCRIADVFNHTEKDVLRALKYWEQAGLLDLCFDSEKTLTNIIIKPLYSKVDTPDTSAVHNVTAATVAAQAISVLSKTPIESAKNTKEGSIPAEMSSSDNKQFIKHTYTANELKEFKSQNEVIEFTYLAEKYLGKTLNGSDINSLLFIYDVLGFSAELIGFLLEYCVTNGHKSMRYIEKVA